MSQKAFTLTNLLETLTSVTFQACRLFQTSQYVKVCYKESMDPVTCIDHTIQKFISSKIESLYPKIEIVGEEMVDEAMLIAQIEQEQKNIKPLSLFVEKNQDYKESQLTVFIDPLDCTRGFLCDRKWECTVLVGLVYKGQPIFGVIGLPYKEIQKVAQNGKKYVYQPRILVGGTIFSQKCAYKYHNEKWQKIVIPHLNTTNQSTLPLVKIALSSRRPTFLPSLSFQPILCGGSGNKISKLVFGQVDAVMFLQTPTSTWDSCAGQAIVKGMGGHFCKPDGKNIEYRGNGANIKKQNEGNTGQNGEQNVDQTNNQGFLVCLNNQIWQQIFNAVSKKEQEGL